MEIWNQAKNFSPQKGKPLGWMVTLARRRAIDGLRKKQAYARAEERLQNETEQQPDAWVHKYDRRGDRAQRYACSHSQGDRRPSASPAGGYRPRIFSGHESARNRGKNEYTLRNGEDAA